MTYNAMVTYKQLKNRLWVGTLLLDFVFLLTVFFFSPKQFLQAVSGVGMGIYYLWSLFYNADHPKKAMQFVFSIIRVCILAYGAVYVSHFRVYELGIVICGLLSYKVILTVEYIIQAIQSYRFWITNKIGASFSPP